MFVVNNLNDGSMTLSSVGFIHSLNLFKDYRLRRQLVFRAQYKLKCSLVSGDIARATLTSIITHNFLQIEEICQKGKTCV